MDVVKLPEAKRSFLMLSLRWVVERSRAGTTRFRPLASDECVPNVVASLHLSVFVSLMRHRLVTDVAQSPLLGRGAQAKSQEPHLPSPITPHRSPS